MASSFNRKRSRALETTAIVVGLVGLAVVAVGPVARGCLAQEAVGRGVVVSVPEQVRGARLDAMGSKRPPVRARLDAPSSKPAKMQTMIPASSFEVAAKLEGVAKRKNGTLSFDRTRDGKYVRVPMSVLANFPYKPALHPPGAAALGIPAPKAAVPDEILAIDGKDAGIVGFMVAIDVDTKGVKEFVLSQNRSFCCYGITPALNEMVLVRMEDGVRAPFVKDYPIAVFGKLAVSEQREDGHVVSLYRMEASKTTDLATYAQAWR